MISPQELQKKLLETGCPVTARQLTDWRSKGLLPPLASRGRGKGRGKIYFWNEPDILVRAQFVHHAFAHGATAEIAMLSVVHGGFYVESKSARRVWIRYLNNLEKLSERKIEFGETARDAYWNLALSISHKVSQKSAVPKQTLNPLIAEVLGTIYALRGFRPSADELDDIVFFAKQYLTAAMADSRHRKNRRFLRKLISKKLIERCLELLRQGLSVTATKELIKGTTIEQFDLAISTTRLIIRAIETFSTTQFKGETCGEPILDVRVLFRAFPGPQITAFFLQLVGAGYERKLLKSSHVLERFISNCEANSGLNMTLQSPIIPQELQGVMEALYSDLKEIWRDSNLFRMYHIA